MARAEKIIHNGKVLNFEETVDLLCKTKSFLDEANNCLSQYEKENEELKNETRQLEWENGEIRKDFDSCKSVLLANEMERQEMKKQISELESELRVKEDLFKIQGGLKSPDVKIANLPYLEESRPSIEWYEDRYQSDCITINQLNTTIDVLTDKLARLRG